MANVFLLVATGYIGGSLIVSLSKAYSNTVFTALVRSESDFSAIRTVGVTPARGNFSNHDLNKDLSAAVVDAADKDNSELEEGASERREGTIFMDNNKDGLYDQNLKIWIFSKDFEGAISSLTTPMHHGQVDVPGIRQLPHHMPANRLQLGLWARQTRCPFLPVYPLEQKISEHKEIFYVGESSNVNNISTVAASSSFLLSIAYEDAGFTAM
ncbi:hypothetical protein DFH11DRAFT_1811387 [Phellopilus nigrolimitatus]|nr:hypothetical protein DFH11DRAFT_1811387 [Phellopilus nigrolimitatus]